MLPSGAWILTLHGEPPGGGLNQPEVGAVTARVREQHGQNQRRRWLSVIEQDGRDSLTESSTIGGEIVGSGGDGDPFGADVDIEQPAGRVEGGQRIIDGERTAGRDGLWSRDRIAGPGFALGDEVDLRLLGSAGRIGDHDLGLPVGGADARGRRRGRDKPGLARGGASGVSSCEGEGAGCRWVEPVGEAAFGGPIAGPVGIHPAVDIVPGRVAARRGAGGEGADTELVRRIEDARSGRAALGGALLPLVDPPLIVAGAVIVDLVEGVVVERDRLHRARWVVDTHGAGRGAAGSVPARVVDVERRVGRLVEQNQREVGSGLPFPERNQSRAALILRSDCRRSADRRLGPRSSRMLQPWSPAGHLPRSAGR